jgi:hypothetical protein
VLVYDILDSDQLLVAFCMPAYVESKHFLKQLRNSQTENGFRTLPLI